MTERRRKSGPGRCRQRWALFLVAIFGNQCHKSDEHPPAGEREEELRTVLLVVVDTLRADRLSCMGYDQHQTPSFDTLADRGVLFRNAFSAASWTRPSMASLMTSRYPTELGLVETSTPPGKTWGARERRTQQSKALPDSAATMAEILQAEGFRTAAFVNQPALSRKARFSRGFEDWYTADGSGRVSQHDPTLPETKQAWPSTSVSASIDRGLVQALVEWLQDSPDAKAFAWLHLLTPHGPYLPEEPYAPKEPASDSQRYDGEVRAVDAMLAPLWELARLADPRRTLVIFTSDHGEEFLEHGDTEHGHSLHREVVQVPLIVAGPGFPPGTAIEDAVRTIDILPTVADLLGLPGQPDWRGESLRSSANPSGDKRTVYAEAMLYGSSERSLLQHPWKIMHDQQGEQWSLFHVERDPGEQENLVDSHSRERDGMVQKLQAFHQQIRRAATRPASPDGDEALDEDLEALQALGYLRDE